MKFSGLYVDLGAHVTGLLIGVGMTWLFCRERQELGPWPPLARRERAALASLTAIFLISFAMLAWRTADPKTQIEDRIVMAERLKAVEHAGPYIDASMAWVIAHDPAADAKLLQDAVFFGERAAEADLGNNRTYTIVNDALAAAYARLGHLDRAIDLAEPLWRVPGPYFPSQLMRFMDKYWRTNGVRLLSDRSITMRRVTAEISRDDEDDLVTVTVADGAKIEQGVVIYALVHKDDRLYGLLRVALAPRDEQSYEFEEYADYGTFGELGVALTAGAEVSVVQYDTGGCGCRDDETGEMWDDVWYLPYDDRATIWP